MIRFGEWLPDLPELENPGALEAKNVFPATALSYGPIQDLESVGNALTARAQGGGSFRGVGGTVFVTAFDATKAYQWDGSAWNDVSRTVGGAYACAAADMWSVTQFGDSIVAVNGTDAPQVWTIASSSNYAALAGSPPVGRFVCTIKDFVQIGRISSAKNRVKWSSINDITAWTVGTNQCDEQDLPEGGQVMGMAGGEYGTILMERSIYNQLYVGSPAIFQFNRVTGQLGCCAENSVATYEQTTIFLAFDGFYSISAGQNIEPIGTQKVNNYFWSSVNVSYLNRVHGVMSPDDLFYLCAYPSTASTDGAPDRLLIYSLALKRWTRAEMSLDYMMLFLSGVGYHTDNIDTVITDTDATDYLTDSNPFFGSGGTSLAAFTTAKKLATFQGSTLEATVDTTEAQITPGQRTFISEVWPYCDGGSLTIQLGTRDLPTSGVTWSGAVAVNAQGFCPIRVDSRFVRGRAIVAAGGTWKHLQGMQPKGRASGRY